MTPDTNESIKALPLSESTTLILVSLGAGPKHGYAILKEVQALSRGRVNLSTGTLYGAIKRMLADGWIRRVLVSEARQDSRERKYYALTDSGQRVLQAETRRMRELVSLAERRLAPGAQSGGS
jgi:DNA-binding PadR family transcriptional regulator